MSPNLPFDPEKIPGVSFFDAASDRMMRYIYPSAGHWSSGWIVVQNPSGDWMTLRKAAETDIVSILKCALGSSACSTRESVVTIEEADAVNLLWSRAKLNRGDAGGCDEYIAFRLLARAAYRVLKAGVTPEDVEQWALKQGYDIRDCEEAVI